MKKLFLLTLLLSLFSQAQVNRFVYEYKFIPDATKKDSVVTEIMALDITDKGSTYQSLNGVIRDSVMREQFKNITPGGPRNFNFQNMQRVKVNYRVTKDYPDYKTTLIERLGRDTYKILEDEKQTWTILPETTKIGDYKAQKATTTWGGRQWTAWFSTDLPFQDGPYKFSGLPGLIVKLEDSTASHVMTLAGNKKVPAQSADAGSAMPFRMNQEVAVNESQYKKAYKTYIADPSRSMREMSSGAGGQRIVVQMRDQNGRELDFKEMAKRMDKEVKDSDRRNNNRIEPSLYDGK